MQFLRYAPVPPHVRDALKSQARGS
jgi:hypothetical protein